MVASLCGVVISGQFDHVGERKAGTLDGSQTFFFGPSLIGLKKKGDSLADPQEIFVRVLAWLQWLGGRGAL